MLGPSVVRYDRTAYNLAASQASNDQLLLNLLRLRDGEAVYVLELTAVLSQFKFDARASFGGWWNNINRIDNNSINAYYGLDTFATQQSNWGVDASYMESPTISYAPLQGEQFAQRFMQPIPLATLLALAESGWRIDRVFECCVQRLNNLDNAPVGDQRDAGSISTAGFLECARLLSQRPPRTRFETGTGGKDIYLVAEDGPAAHETWTRLTGLLGVPAGTERIRVVEGAVQRGTGELAIQSRSLLGVMLGLAHASESDALAAGRGAAPEAQADEPWLRIHASAEPPREAYVQVRRGQHWYSIAGSDLRSKRTFSLLAYLSSLRASDIATAAPIVTVPSR